MLKQKAYLLLENLARLNDFDWYFKISADNSGFNRYLFQLIVLSKPDFNCGNNFALSWVDKVPKGT